MLNPWKNQLVSTLSLRLLFLGVGLLAWPGCKQNPNNANAANRTDAHASLRLGFLTAVARAPVGPIGWAMEKGLLQPALSKIGIDQIVLYPAPIGPDLNEAFAANGIDLALTGDVPGLIGKSARLPTKLVNLDMTGINLALIVRQDGPKNVEELSGRKVSTAFGTILSHYLNGLLIEKGLTDKVTIVNLSVSAVEAALIRGDIDAGVVTAPAFYARRGFRVIDQACDHKNLTGNSITVATESFLKAHPDFVTVWNQIRAQSITDMENHPDDFYRYFAANSQYPADLLPQLYPLSLFSTNPFPNRGVSAIENTKVYLQNSRLIQHDFSIAEWSTLPLQGDTTLKNGATN